MSTVVARKGAVGTVAEAARWSLGFPALIALFLAVDVIDAAGGSAAVSLVRWLAAVYAGGVAYVYAEAQLENRTVSFDEALGQAADHFLSLLGVAVVYAVAVFVGSVLLVLPGIYLAARLLVAFPAVVVDDVGFAEALGRGWDAGGGNVLKLLGIMLLLLVPALVAIGGAAALFGLESLTQRDPRLLLLAAPVTAVVSATLELASARVYVENRPERSGSPGTRGRDPGRAGVDPGSRDTVGQRDRPTDPDSGDARVDDRWERPDDHRDGGRGDGRDDGVVREGDDHRRS